MGLHGEHFYHLLFCCFPYFNDFKPLQAKTDSNFSTNKIPTLPATIKSIRSRGNSQRNLLCSPCPGRSYSGCCKGLDMWRKKRINSYHFQFAFGDPADAVGSEVGVARLDAAQAAEVLVTLFLPLCNQVFVSVSFLDAVLVELCRGADTIMSSSREVLEDSLMGITSCSN